MKKGVLICFIGIDGSGKSTLAKLLLDRMNKKEVITDYVWCKFDSSLFKLLIFLKDKLLMKKYDLKKNYDTSRKIKKNLFENKIFSSSYEIFIIVDYYFQILMKTAIPLRSKNLICDRYIYDTFVDVAIDLDYSDEKLKNIIKKFLAISPKPNLIFLVDLPEDVALRRKSDIPSIGFLTERRELYKKIGSEFKVVTLDGTKNIQELSNEIDTYCKNLIFR